MYKGAFNAHALLFHIYILCIHLPLFNCFWKHWGLKQTNCNIHVSIPVNFKMNVSHVMVSKPFQKGLHWNSLLEAGQGPWSLEGF